MDIVVWVITGATLGLVSPFIVLRFRQHRDMARAGTAGRISSTDTVRPRNPFAAVSVRPFGESPCEAVVQMQARRFLAVRAPALPVPGCDRKQCGCRYVRHADRRRPADRRDEFARYGGLTPKVRKEQRLSERRERR